MKTSSFPRVRKGFTLIEIIVVIAILAVLMAIGSTPLLSHMSAGDEAKCRANLEQLAQLGTKYSHDIAKRGTLPTSGMDDDEDTEFIDESEGWWLSLAPMLDAVTLPQKAGQKMKVSTIFHCPSDQRFKPDSTASVFEADCRSVSYVSWTDASEDPANPNSPIKTTAKQNLDMLPWLSDGNPVKGVSVTDAESFAAQVVPASERHNGKIFVLMASGTVKAVDVDEESDAGKVFKKLAPSLAKKAAGGKDTAASARKPADDEDDEDDDEPADNVDSEDDETDDDED